MATGSRLRSGVGVVAALALAAAACGVDPQEGEDAVEAVTAEAQALGAPIALSRQHVVGDVYHYELVLPIGATPNAQLRLHRVVREAAPWVPRPTIGGAMLLHGDFSTFESNFAPSVAAVPSAVHGLAPYLAQRGFDVWGGTRRWAGATTDVSDFAGMTAAQELDDLRAMLAFARATRAATGHGAGRLALVGFSHGAQLAYAYAAVEGARPPAQRHIDALVPLDFYGAIAPDQPELREMFCAWSAGEYGAVADGFVDVDNSFFIQLGTLARTAPDDPSPFPFLAGFTNHGAFLLLAGQTYQLAPYTPWYHLAAPILDGDTATGLAESTEASILAWFEGAAPHQAMIESADLDSLLCGDTPALAAPLSSIEVPLFYIGAAGGVGDLGVYATTQVASADVTSLVVRRAGPDGILGDLGHGDLLFAADAPQLVWKPLAAWLKQH